MKPHLLSWTLLLLTTAAHAQSDKTTVGILPFSYVNTSEVMQRVETINELVESAFVKANRQTIVSRMNFTDLKEEVDRNKGTEFIDGKALNQGRQFGAQYLVKGRVLSAGATQSYNQTTRTTSYSGKVGLSVKVLDVETGQVVASEVLQGGAIGGGGLGTIGGGLLQSFLAISSSGSASSPEEAIDGASRDLAVKVYDWVTKRFVARLSILKTLAQDDSKGTQVILVGGGSGIGLQSGSRLKVVEMEEIDIDGKTEVREIEVARLKVDKVEGERFSTCKVTEGGKELQAKLNAKAKLKALTVR